MEQYDISLIMEVVDVSETVIPNFVMQLNRCVFVFIRDLIRKSSLCKAKAYSAWEFTTKKVQDHRKSIIFRADWSMQEISIGDFVSGIYSHILAVGFYKLWRQLQDMATQSVVCWGMVVCHEYMINHSCWQSWPTAFNLQSMLWNGLLVDILS